MSAPPVVRSPLSGRLVEEVHTKVTEVAERITGLEGEQARLMSKPIDILCFGRAGVGKTTLLEALTGRNLGSSSKLDHGTTKLECITIKEELPTKQGGVASVHLRFWDSKGIEKWSGADDLQQLFNELASNNVNPLCIFYCATGHGRVESKVVTEMLRMFAAKGVAVFYIVTNMYALSDDEYMGQWDGAKAIMTSACNGTGIKQAHEVYKFGERCFLLAVNSKNYASRMGQKPAQNIDVLMQLCVSNLNEQQLADFFLATLHNRNFWDKAHDQLKTVLSRLEAAGIDARGFVATAWGKLRSFLDTILSL